MAIYTVPERGWQIPLQTQVRDQLFTLDVLWADKYENETICPTNARKMEFEFYKGAPPQWLNFYWAEHENSPLVRRDLYDELQRKITEATRQRRSVAQINLLHDPGSGGSTLAMQVLWDRRKELRCAKLLPLNKDSPNETQAIAKQVLQLFRANGLETQNTVLLLLDKKHTREEALFREELKEHLCDEIKANNITDQIPVVIILNCVHRADMTEGTRSLRLSSKLSEAEKERFTAKQSVLVQTHGNGHTKLYAFNIMLRDYDAAYVTEVCGNLLPFKDETRPHKQQLLAFLALINSYVPGSDLPHDLCRQFLSSKSNNLDRLSFEQHMQPFTDFLVLFSTKEDANSEAEHVRMVHPMITQECLRLLTEAGVRKSDTTLGLMEELCMMGDDKPTSLAKTIKTLLTKREMKQDSQEKFSRLILDIKSEEPKGVCVKVLETALNIFAMDAFFPQALARFCYSEMKDYEEAEHWAKMAIRRDERNSFIRDTLGQTHKSHLRNVISKRPAREILHYGKKATESFQDEENVAKREGTPELQEDGKTTTKFNTWGIFGYMQVANMIFNYLNDRDSEWASVLSEEAGADAFLGSYDGGKCREYKDFVTGLRKEIEHKFEFFEWYLLYSKQSIHKDEPNYLWREIEECYKKYVSQSQQNKSTLQILKEQQASTFAGLLKQAQIHDLEKITQQWKEIYLLSPSDPQNILNYIAANVMLSQSKNTSAALAPVEELQSMLQNLWTEQKDKRDPEFYLSVLLLFWPDEQHTGPNRLNISECVAYMHRSFETRYKYFLRSRYLVPLFFLSERPGIQRFIHKSCLDEASFDTLMDASGEVAISQLRRVRGEVRNHKIFAVEKSETVEVSADNRTSVHGDGKVSFYLGLKICGPVAYNIKYEQKRGR